MSMKLFFAVQPKIILQNGIKKINLIKIYFIVRGEIYNGKNRF